MLSGNRYVLSFPENLAFSDEELFRFCLANPDVNVERDKNKRLIIMSPTGSLSGHVNSIINAELVIWNKINPQGLVFDSSTGFLLPDGSMRSPDAAWVSLQQWDKLSQEEKEKFAPVCPEFVVEVKSPTDSISQLQDKMQEWIANGVKLAWLFDIKETTVYIYDEKGLDSTLKRYDNRITGKKVLPGFKFELGLLT